jgi:heme/copper-type cytochrome/quinol oxidase subunit 1
MIQLQQNGGYLIDTDGDGTFDYEYQVQSDEPQSLPEQLYIALVILFIGILFVTLLVVTSMFYGKRKRAKNQEHTETVEEWPTSPNEK